jgi:NCAIR mutase (PurE)-related protein
VGHGSEVYSKYGKLTDSRDRDYACIDLDRADRTGDPEAVYGAGKTVAQLLGCLAELHRAHPDRPVLATRVSPEGLTAARERWPEAETDELGRTVVLGSARPARGLVAVVCAGTSDLPVALECATTVRAFGAAAELHVDLGVAGIHRLLDRSEQIAAADAVVAVAGMEAALPSVLAGLIGAPLIAVPTSVGYGWHLDGLTAFLAVLNSCGPGVTTVNVDNGFGAGVAAARIARQSAR